MSEVRASGELAGLLGEGARYEGDLVFHGRVRIDGTFVGSLHTDDLLEVGPHGVIEGDAQAAQALVAGTVAGTLRALERVTLLETALVSGTLTTPWLDVRLGARLAAEVQVQRAGEER